MREAPALRALREQGAAQQGGHMQIGPDQAQFLAWLLQLMRAKRVITQPRHGAPHRSHFHVRIYCADDDRPMCKDRPPFYSWHQRPDSAPSVASVKPNES